MDFLSRRLGGMVVDAATYIVTTIGYILPKVVLDEEPAMVEIGVMTVCRRARTCGGTENPTATANEFCEIPGVRHTWRAQFPAETCRGGP
jgi:hypothetical protein